MPRRGASFAGARYVPEFGAFELDVRAGRVNGVAILSALRAVDYQSRSIQYESRLAAETVAEANRRIRMIFP